MLTVQTLAHDNRLDANRARQDHCSANTESGRLCRYTEKRLFVLFELAGEISIKYPACPTAVFELTPLLLVVY